ncbi:MAG: CBS domain-containing protein [Lachnospiraceae bacterium]|nr:CBS domain-containing protein [Lachnospiraceae bacterium]
MNILACLTPKSDVDYITDEATLFKAMQTMLNRNFSAIPIINKKGRYVGTITAADILGCIKENFDLSLKESANFPIRNVRRTRDYKAIGVNTLMEGILEKAVDQNFVPVVDDEDNFIGILTRTEIMRWMREKYNYDHPEGGN